MFLTHINRLLRTKDSNLIDIESDPRVAFVVTGGGSLKHWVNRQYLSKLKRIEVHIYDRDDAEDPKYKSQVDSVNARGDGSCAYLTKKREMENYIHPDAIKDALGHLISFTDDCDVPAIIAQAIHDASSPPKAWAILETDKKKSKADRQKSRLNDEAASKMTLKHLEVSDPANEIEGWFAQIGLRVRNPSSYQTIAPDDLKKSATG